MTALHEILQSYDAMKKQHRSGVLAMVVNVRGSSTCRPGARMLITEEGETTGTLGSSTLDAAIVNKRAKSISSGKIFTLAYDNAPETEKENLTQGGISVLHLILEPIPTWEISPHLEFIRRSLSSESVGIIAMIFRVDGEIKVSAGERVMVKGNGIVEASTSNPFVNAALLTDCRDILQTHQSSIKRYNFTEGVVEAFIEVIQSDTSLQWK
ncbi:MAG: XdhC family protein [bacterium]